MTSRARENETSEGRPKQVAAEGRPPPVQSRLIREKPGLRPGVRRHLVRPCLDRRPTTHGTRVTVCVGQTSGGYESLGTGPLPSHPSTPVERSGCAQCLRSGDRHPEEETGHLYHRRKDGPSRRDRRSGLHSPNLQDSPVCLPVNRVRVFVRSLGPLESLPSTPPGFFLSRPPS